MYNFYRMMIVIVMIFVFFTVSKLFDLIIVVWSLDLISVVYSIIFLNQEIPILIHNEKRIQKIIRKSIHNDDLKLSLGEVPKKIEMNYAVQNILLTEGIVIAYQMLKTKDKEKNREYFDYLLNLQNCYLLNYIENHTLVLKDLSKEYQNIAILDAIATSIKNIHDIINVGDKLNILEMYGDENHFYHITRSLFFLYRILNELKFDRKFSKEFSGIFQNMFMRIKFGEISISETRFLYKILNAMVISTLSNEELWFVEILRDSVYGDMFSVYGTNEYFVFFQYTYII